MRRVKIVKQKNTIISVKEIDRRMQLGELVVIKARAKRGNSKARDVFTRYALWRYFPNKTKMLLLIQAYIRYKNTFKRSSRGYYGGKEHGIL